jgi:alkylhydroperoxidase family enzyme
VEVLHDLGWSDDRLAALQGDFSGAEFTPREMALLRLAEQLTVAPAEAADATRAATAAGWSDTEVAHAIFVISYFNMVTRIADGFALPPDDAHAFAPGAALPMLRCPPR